MFLFFRLIYFHKEDCAATENLKKYFLKDHRVEASFLKKIPEDFFETNFKKNETVIVFDDFHSDLLTNKELGNLIYEISSVLTHHNGLVVLLSVQSFDIIKKQSKLNNVFMNSSHIIFFRTAHDVKSIRRYLGNYEIALKSPTLTLWQIFQKFVQTKQFAYMLICVSPRCKRQTVFSNVLMKDDGPMLSFHESDSESDQEEVEK